MFFHNLLFHEELESIFLSLCIWVCFHKCLRNWNVTEMVLVTSGARSWKAIWIPLACLSVCLSFRISASVTLSTTQLGHARKAIWRDHQCLRAPSCQGAPSPGTTHVSEEIFEVTPPNRDCLTAISWNTASQKFPAEPFLNSWPQKPRPSLFYHYVLGDFITQG